MITAEQLRAGLAALQWPQKKLCDKCGVNPRTMQRMLACRGVPKSFAENVDKAQRGLEKGDRQGCIEFTKAICSPKFPRKPYIATGILFHPVGE